MQLCAQRREKYKHAMMTQSHLTHHATEKQTCRHGDPISPSNGANAPSLLPSRLVDVGLDSNVNSGDGQVAAVVVLDVVKGANESIVRLGLSCSGVGAGSGEVRRHNRDIPSGANLNGSSTAPSHGKEVRVGETETLGERELLGVGAPAGAGKGRWLWISKRWTSARPKQARSPRRGSSKPAQEECAKVVQTLIYSFSF